MDIERVVIDESLVLITDTNGKVVDMEIGNIVIEPTIDKFKVMCIVGKIIDDICDRKGLGDEWDCLDSAIQSEIRQEWVKIIIDTLEEGA